MTGRAGGRPFEQNAGRIDDQLRSLEGSAEAGELTAASDAAARLRDTLGGLKPGP